MGKTKEFLVRGSGVIHYYKEIPATLKPFVDYVFSTGGVAGDDFKSFNTKFHNFVKKTFSSSEFNIHKWVKGHYYCSAVLRDKNGKFYYLSIPDVRYERNGWIDDILIRTMKHENDWSGGTNSFTSIFSLKEDLEKLCEREKMRKRRAYPVLMSIRNGDKLIDYLNDDVLNKLEYTCDGFINNKFIVYSNPEEVKVKNEEYELTGYEQNLVKWICNPETVDFFIASIKYYEYIGALNK